MKPSPKKKRKARKPGKAPKGGMARSNMAGIYPDGNIWVDVEDPEPKQVRALASWLLKFAEWAESK